jgi:bifunctional DNase/RNase
MAISMAINNVAIPRPMTHDLILNVMKDMGGHLDHVEILSIDKGTYYAALVVGTPQGVKRIDSRPSDSIALALKAGVSIMASTSMLEQSLAQQKGQYQAVIEGEDAKQWTEILAKYDLDDIRFKM